MGRFGSFFCLAPHSVKREAEEDWTLIKQNPRISLRRFFIQRAKLVGGVPTNSAYCTADLCEAVTLLDLAFKLISFAVDCGKAIVGEISWGSHQGGRCSIPGIRSHPEGMPIRLVEFDKRYN